MEEYIDNIDMTTISEQTLAFIGDAVYNVYVRSYLASVSTAKAGQLHVMSIKYVSCKGQAQTIDKLMDMLTDEEIARLEERHRQRVLKRIRERKGKRRSRNRNTTTQRSATPRPSKRKPREATQDNGLFGEFELDGYWDKYRS